VTHAYLLDWLRLGGQGSRPAQVNNFQDPIFKITRAKWTEGVIQTVECLLCKSEALSSNPRPATKKNENSPVGT
jgi:hypothetical protein